MAKNSAKVSKRGLPGSRGRKASTTDNPAGRASQPKGKKSRIGPAGYAKGANVAVKSGSSGRALPVTSKQK